VTVPASQKKYSDIKDAFWIKRVRGTRARNTLGRKRNLLNRMRVLKVHKKIWPTEWN
jgi:hypothetical protein